MNAPAAALASALASACVHAHLKAGATETARKEVEAGILRQTNANKYTHTYTNNTRPRQGSVPTRLSKPVLESQLSHVHFSQRLRTAD